MVTNEIHHHYHRPRKQLSTNNTTNNDNNINNNNKLLNRVISYMSLQSKWKVNQLDPSRLDYTLELSIKRKPKLTMKSNPTITMGTLFLNFIRQYHLPYLYLDPLLEEVNQDNNNNNFNNNNFNNNNKNNNINNNKNSNNNNNYNNNNNGNPTNLLLSSLISSITEDKRVISSYGGYISNGFTTISGKLGIILISKRTQLGFLEDSFFNRIPIILIQSQSDLIIPLHHPHVKLSIQVHHLHQLFSLLQEGIITCRSGSPGPVVITLSDTIYQDTPHPTNPIPTYKPPRYTKSFKELRQFYNKTNQVHHVANLINLARRPIILVGRGIMAIPGGKELIKKLSQSGDIPVATSIHALGILDERDERSLRMVGRYGGVVANLAIQHADVIIGVGVSFNIHITGDPTQFAPAAKLAERQHRGGIIQFESEGNRDYHHQNFIQDLNHLDDLISITEVVRGDLGQNLGLLLPQIQSTSHPQWFEEISHWRSKFPISLGPNTGRSGRLRPQFILNQLDQQLSSYQDNLILTSGVGLHQMWVAQWITFITTNFVTSSQSNPIGFGIPSAIGIKLAHPDKMVIAIETDQSSVHSFHALTTAVQYQLDVKVLILNNGSLTSSYPTPYNLFPTPSPSPSLPLPDYLTLAQSLNCFALRCSYPDTLPDALHRWLTYTGPGPIVLEIMTDFISQSFPFVPPGHPLHRPLLDPHHHLDPETLPAT